VFFTGAGYTAQTTQYANEHQVALFVCDLAGRMSPQNPAAKELERRATHGSADSAEAAELIDYSVVLWALLCLAGGVTVAIIADGSILGFVFGAFLTALFT
jgi:hypothetical protein